MHPEPDSTFRSLGETRHGTSEAPLEEGGPIEPLEPDVDIGEALEEAGEDDLPEWPAGIIASTARGRQDRPRAPCPEP